ncbi:MAG: hypothetical protein ACOCRO_06390 [Halanaerobiales bacterium]
MLKKKPWFITTHSLKRLKERLGEDYWYGMKIKNMGVNQQRRFMLKYLNKPGIRKVRKDCITFKVETRYFVAIVVEGYKFNKIETIYKINEEPNKGNKFSCSIKQILAIKNQQLVQELTCH